MKYNSIAMIIISIITFIGGMILNFPEFLMGSAATVKNLIVTFSYITIWAFISIISIKSKDKRVIKYCLVFWIITMVLAIVTMYVNATGISADLAIPFVILFLGQWYGINNLVGSFLNTSIVIAIISLAMATVSIISLKRAK